VSPARRLLIGAITLITATLGYAAGRVFFRPAEAVSQPIAFNHQKHVEELEIPCNECHRFYERGEHSGLPALSICTGCHDDTQTDNPELKKLVELAAEGRDDVFRKLFRMPDHVFYSHRRHVVSGKIECATCHGAIAATQSPPATPMVRITMDFCIECHRQSETSVDCTRCHR